MVRKRLRELLSSAFTVGRLEIFFADHGYGRAQAREFGVAVVQNHRNANKEHPDHCRDWSDSPLQQKCICRGEHQTSYKQLPSPCWQKKEEEEQRLKSYK